jgi:uncharacterized protein
MRLRKEEILAIKDTVKELDAGCRIILFGSRADDSKKGGDIDLLLYSKKLKFNDKIKILARLNEKLGEQKIDIIIAGNNLNPFVKYAEKNGVEL